MLTPNPLIIAMIAPNIMAITSSAWFSMKSCAASAADALAGIGVCRAPVPRTKNHSAASTTPMVTVISVAIRSRISPGSVPSSQFSHAHLRWIPMLISLTNEVIRSFSGQVHRKAES